MLPYDLKIFHSQNPIKSQECSATPPEPLVSLKFPRRNYNVHDTVYVLRVRWRHFCSMPVKFTVVSDHKNWEYLMSTKWLNKKKSGSLVDRHGLIRVHDPPPSWKTQQQSRYIITTGDYMIEGITDNEEGLLPPRTPYFHASIPNKLVPSPLQRYSPRQGHAGEQNDAKTIDAVDGLLVNSSNVNLRAPAFGKTVRSKSPVTSNTVHSLLEIIFCGSQTFPPARMIRFITWNSSITTADIWKPFLVTQKSASEGSETFQELFCHFRTWTGEIKFLRVDQGEI
jgi:hypothetical protein